MLNEDGTGVAAPLDELDDDRLRQKVLRAFNNYSLYEDDFNDDGRYDPSLSLVAEPMSPCVPILPPQLAQPTTRTRTAPPALLITAAARC